MNHMHMRRDLPGFNDRVNAAKAGLAMARKTPEGISESREDGDRGHQKGRQANVLHIDYREAGASTRTRL